MAKSSEIFGALQSEADARRLEGGTNLDMQQARIELSSNQSALKAKRVILKENDEDEGGNIDQEEVMDYAFAD